MDQIRSTGSATLSDQFFVFAERDEKATPDRGKSFTFSEDSGVAEDDTRAVASSCSSNSSFGFPAADIRYRSGYEDCFKFQAVDVRTGSFRAPAFSARSSFGDEIFEDPSADASKGKHNSSDPVCISSGENQTTSVRYQSEGNGPPGIGYPPLNRGRNPASRGRYVPTRGGHQPPPVCGYPPPNFGYDMMRGGFQTTTSGGQWTTTSGGQQTTTRGGQLTTTSSGQTTTSGGQWTTTSGRQQTTTRGGQLTTTSGGLTTTSDGQWTTKSGGQLTTGVRDHSTSGRHGHNTGEFRYQTISSSGHLSSSREFQPTSGGFNPTSGSFKTPTSGAFEAPCHGYVPTSGRCQPMRHTAEPVCSGDLAAMEGLSGPRRDRLYATRPGRSVVDVIVEQEAHKVSFPIKRTLQRDFWLPAFFIKRTYLGH